MGRKRYPTDLTDGQRGVIGPLLPAAKPGGRPRATDLREVMDTLLYLDRTGCRRETLPHDLLPKGTAYEYFAAWRDDRTRRAVPDALRQKVRRAAGREPTPSAGGLDGQSVKTAGSGGERGFDAAKAVAGRGRRRRGGRPAGARAARRRAAPAAGRGARGRPPSGRTRSVTTTP